MPKLTDAHWLAVAGSAMAVLADARRFREAANREDVFLTIVEVIAIERQLKRVSDLMELDDEIRGAVAREAERQGLLAKG